MKPLTNTVTESNKGMKSMISNTTERKRSELRMNKGVISGYKWDELVVNHEGRAVTGTEKKNRSYYISK